MLSLAWPRTLGKLQRKSKGGQLGGWREEPVIVRKALSIANREQATLACLRGTLTTSQIARPLAKQLPNPQAAILSSRCSKYMSTFTICILRNNHEVKATAHQTPLICTAAALPPGKVPVDFAAVALDDSAIALTAIIAGAAAERQSSHLKMI